MTFQKSLKYKNVSPFAFFNSLRSGALPFFAYFAFMSFILPVVNFIGLYDEQKAINANIIFDESEIRHLSQKYVYSVFGDAKDMSIALTVATIAAGVLMGISVFRFITSKKSVNVYYSLGITRTNLFLARYFAGLVMLFVAIAVPVALSCIIGFAFIGFNEQAIISSLYIVLAVFSLAMLTFSVTAAVMAAVGTSIEAFGFTAIIMLIPTGFMYMIQLIAQASLYGNPFRLGYYFNYSKDLKSISLANEYAEFNPILYLHTMFEDDLIGRMRTSELTLKQLVSDYMHPMTAVLWIGVAVAITVLTVIIFNKRKAEICGFFGSCKTLNFVAAFVAGMLVFTVSTAAFYESTKTFSIIVTLIGIAISYILINLIFTRSIKKTFRSIYLIGTEYIAVAIILTIFATGGFGYSSRLPKAAEIKSAEISTVAYETTLTDDDVYVYTNYQDTLLPFTETLSDTTLGPYTSADDVQKILKLHSKMIQLGTADENSLFNTNIIIHYKLTDGSDFYRYYEKADIEALRMNLKLYETDFMRDKIEDIFLNDTLESDYDDYYSYGYSMNYEDTKVIAVSPSLNTSAFKYLELDENQFNKLKNAVVNDLKSMSSEQFYTPDKPAIGALVFRQANSLFTYSEAENKEVEIEENMLVRYVFDSEATNESKIFLTPYMAETLAFLEQNGLMEYFTPVSADEVESISFIPAVIDKNDYYYSMGISFVLDFMAENELLWIETDENEESFEQNSIKDKAKISEILKFSQLKYYTANEGYICRIRYKNGETVRKYISAADAPDYVRNYAYKTPSGENYAAPDSDIAIIGGADGPTAIIVAETK